MPEETAWIIPANFCDVPTCRTWQISWATLGEHWQDLSDGEMSRYEEKRGFKELIYDQQNLVQYF